MRTHSVAVAPADKRPYPQQTVGSLALDRWMHEHDMSSQVLGHKIYRYTLAHYTSAGAHHKNTLSAIRLGRKRPSLITALAIEKVTGGEVKAEGFALCARTS
jgi:hypothetical protein